MITQSKLKKIIHYDPVTGIFTWIIHRGFIGANTAAKGKDAIWYDGERYLKKRLAWLYMTGVWRTKRIYFIDGDETNFRFTNLSINRNKTHVDIGCIVNKNSYGFFIIDNGKIIDLGIHDTLEGLQVCLELMIEK